MFTATTRLQLIEIKPSSFIILKRDDVYLWQYKHTLNVPHSAYVFQEVFDFLCNVLIILFAKFLCFFEWPKCNLNPYIDISVKLFSFLLFLFQSMISTNDRHLDIDNKWKFWTRSGFTVESSFASKYKCFWKVYTILVHFITTVHWAIGTFFKKQKSLL